MGQPRKLWRAMSSILGSTGKSSCDGVVPPSAHEFLKFFNEKVDAVRRETGGSPPESSVLPPAALFSEFENYDAETIEKSIRTAPSKSCSLDPIPTNILKEFLLELLPFLTRMCSMSLQEGCLPTSQWQAIVTPRINKPRSDASEVKNYRPISDLTFLS